MIITAGEVRLRSGKWRWELLGGEKVRFVHYVMEGQPDNQMMRPLVSEAAVDDATAKRFASHPGTRVWVAPDGSRWLIHDLSYLARWRQRGPRELMMVDAEGEPFRVEVSESLELGQMDDAELAELTTRARAKARDGVSDESGAGGGTGGAPDTSTPGNS
jgi:hypothetical protein